MKRILVRVLAGIGALTVLVFLLLIVIGLSMGGPEEMPDTVVLEVDFNKPIAEYVPEDPLSKIRSRDVLVMRDVVEALGRAGEDDRVRGLYARVDEAAMGLGQIQEIRDAVAAFRRSGKPAVVWSQTFGEFGPGNGGYYLATAFDAVYLQPSGDVGLTGVAVEQPFLKGLFEKLGVRPQMDHRREYKSMRNMIEEDGFTEAHREMTLSLATSFQDQLAGGIASGRGMSVDSVQALIDGGPYLASEALANGLVDGLAYEDEVRDSLKAQAGASATFLRLSAYAARSEPPPVSGTQVALIYGAGGVARGKSQGDPAFGQVMGSDTVAEAFRAAVKDEEVKAILFRVDSPGGSYVASDAIWRETVRAREAGKPVVVSMGNVAGSGGYFVSMSADRIVAQPGTLTGSIGVVAGKMVTRDLWNRIGVTWEDVVLGENAGIFSSLHPYDEAEWERFQAWLDHVYADFTQKAAAGRGMTPEALEEVARGRVWTGEQALERGLVDTLGGFPAALTAVREVLEMPGDAVIRLRTFPPPKDLLETIVASISEGAAVVKAVSGLAGVVEPAARAAQLATPAGFLQMSLVRPTF